MSRQPWTFSGRLQFRDPVISELRTLYCCALVLFADRRDLENLASLSFGDFRDKSLCWLRLNIEKGVGET